MQELLVAVRIQVVDRESTLKDPGLVSFPTIGAKAITFALVDSEGVPDPTPDTRTITVAADTGTFPDLVVDQFDVPSGLVLGQPAHMTYRVKNTGDADISSGSWQDALYISSDPYLDTTDILLATRDLTSKDVGVDSTYEGTFDTVIQSTGDGGFYLGCLNLLL